jgi:hypothetical protein
MAEQFNEDGHLVYALCQSYRLGANLKEVEAEIYSAG